MENERLPAQSECGTDDIFFLLVITRSTFPSRSHYLWTLGRGNPERCYHVDHENQ